MRHRSKKTARAYVARRRLVEAMLQERPICERCHEARSTDVHEVKSRARGGSILDEENCACLCHDCHKEITQNPAMAHAEGWSKHSWED